MEDGVHLHLALMQSDSAAYPQPESLHMLAVWFHMQRTSATQVDSSEYAQVLVAHPLPTTRHMGSEAHWDSWVYLYSHFLTHWLDPLSHMQPRLRAEQPRAVVTVLHWSRQVLSTGKQVLTVHWAAV